MADSADSESTLNGDEVLHINLEAPDVAGYKFEPLRQQLGGISISEMEVDSLESQAPATDVSVATHQQENPVPDNLDW